MNILFLGAHPDDAEIFAFGSLLAWHRLGAHVGLVVATDGAAGGQLPPDALRKVRRAEAVAAAAPLGTADAHATIEE
jgi:N-acetylglucosamine malate deacetylase 1